jgi:hypothetical protein
MRKKDRVFVDRTLGAGGISYDFDYSSLPKIQISTVRIYIQIDYTIEFHKAYLDWVKYCCVKREFTRQISSRRL